VFTARYALIPYIKQIRFVFKGLQHYKQDNQGPEVWDWGHGTGTGHLAVDGLRCRVINKG
jgi:hypothetical protein